MALLGALGAASFLIALLLTPLARDLFARLGFVDHPDGGRKFHARPIPNMGGVPLVISYAAAFALVPLLSTDLPDLSLLIHIAPAFAIILGVGILDDRFNLGPMAKLSLQAAGAVAAYLGGVRVEGISWHHLPPWISFPATIFWLLTCTNALNLIDGMDGLAAGVGAFATATTLLAALLQHNLALAVATTPLLGALLGFLRYNFNPGTIFLGDSGSLVIGFLLGCFGAMWTQKSATLLGMTAPAIALSVPILDVVLAAVRRIRRGQPVFRGDREHIHHRLLALGLSQRRAALILYGVCAVGASLSIYLSAVDRHAGAIVLIFCVVTWAGIQWLRKLEAGQRSTRTDSRTSTARRSPKPLR